MIRFGAAGCYMAEIGKSLLYPAFVSSLRPVSPITLHTCHFYIFYSVSACILMVANSANFGFTGASQVNWSLVYYSMTVATNSLCTLLILFRIVRVSGIGASLKTYRGIIEILLESAAMYAIIYIALLVVYAYEFYYISVTVMTAYIYPMVISDSITVGAHPSVSTILTLISRVSRQLSLLHVLWLAIRVLTTHGRAHPSRTCGAMFSQSQSPCSLPVGQTRAHKRRA